MTTDAWTFYGWLSRCYRFQSPGAFVGPTPGAPGHGLPAAIRASSSAPTSQSSRSLATAAS
jgi:thiamine pyrophosphate-dependent acetolactate synthase large subunit-like protein